MLLVTGSSVRGQILHGYPSGRSGGGGAQLWPYLKLTVSLGRPSRSLDRHLILCSLARHMLLRKASGRVSRGTIVL